MGTVTTLRPSSTSSGTGWSAVPSGTTHGVTSDNSDLTYALWSGSGAPLVLQTPADSPPAGEQRHQVRVRARGEDGDAWWAVRLQTGALTGGASAQFTTSPTTVTGSWGFGAPASGAATLAAHVVGQSTGVKITEIYVDVDTREAPTFTPQILDGSGAVNTAVTDTSTPTLHASSVETDDLAQRQYRYWVTSGATIVWDSGILSGAYTDQLTAPLGNGSYTAHMQIWSTLGANTAYASDEETLAFTVSVGDVPLPNDPTVTPITDTPFYLVEVCAPDVSDFDGDTGYVEIQRVDCAESDDPTAVSIAMLGPLETDECAEWTDYSFPRTGLGADCTHDVEQCCSYYRARTIGRIDGSIVISAWSDVEDTGIPSGLIFMWPDTAASIPTGWDRVTALDDRYPKGIATASTQPGTTGGSASHDHDVPTHQHDVSHFHTITGNTSAAVGSIASADGAVGTTAIAATHTHTRPSTNSTTLNSTATDPGTTTTNNDPARLEVIFIESDGTPAGVPDGALGLTAETTLTGWTDYANADGRFLKGAPDAANGGATAASSASNHTHVVNSHVHAVTSHTHTSANTGSVTSNLSLFAGPNSVTWAANHSHPITISTNDAAALASTSGGASGTTSQGTTEPPFSQIRVKENTSGLESLPVGIIAGWRGSLGTIPGNWALCDGTGGTANLLAAYPKGATSGIGTTGGSTATHTHTSTTHTHTTSGHTHTETVAASGSVVANVSATATVTVSTGTHTHTAAATNSATPTVAASTSGTLAATSSEPAYEEVAFVQLIEPFTPEPEPTVYCLEWTESEHLIRTEGPDGPLWAPVMGTFTWDVERPFTSAIGVNGTRFVTSAPPGGRNLQMTAAVESEEDLATLHEILARPLVLISPSDSTETWAAPVAESVRVIRVGRVRQISAEFIGTGPQPGPQVGDVQ